MFLQEHNLRETKDICPKLADEYEILLNLAIAHSGGTAIIFNKNLNVNIKNCEMSADSRIISAHVEIFGKQVHLINIYAPSGSKNSDRDTFFNDDLTFYLRNSLDYSIVGGDFNCITSQRDSTSNSTHICKTLYNNFKGLNLKDIWNVKNKPIEFTYVRNNYGSRLDRFYLKDFANYVRDVHVRHIAFSDHSSINIELQLPNIPKVGNYYWKLNVSLLNNERIKQLFSIEWNRLKFVINRYSNINEWWERCAKKAIKSFFIKQGKLENQKKYGLLKYLEYSLNRLYNKNNLEHKIDYSKVRKLKNKIFEIKKSILEGVKIRSRIEEQLKGETVSTFLIKKQAQIKKKQFITEIKSEADIVNNLNEGTVLTNSDMIELYICKYYEKLYSEEQCDEYEQNNLINLITNKLDDNDINKLNLNVSDNEIYKAVCDLNKNKAPGIDGIPTEFYQQYWDIIGSEMNHIFKNIITGTFLTESQRSAVITLLPKGGDLKLLKSWRPISLLCNDLKIVSKILANRIKPLLNKIISNSQFCVNERTISHCNNEIRDTLYYYGEHDSTGAVINLDWEKAFDRVNWLFLINIMKKMGFPNFIIKWVLTLHYNIQSMCMVNGKITKPFNIKRGVRQGCPMSMIFYVIFQEPLYKAIEISSKIIPPVIPSKQKKIIGYADDSTIIVSTDIGFIETFKIINNFEKASNSKLNMQKTKVYGFGAWGQRINWPLSGLKVELNHFSTLGLTFSCNYIIALNITWSHIISKIKNRIPLIKNNFYSIYQKSLIVNSLLLSKVWYAAHVYPLPLEHAKVIINEVCSFIWKRNYNPISRNILYNPKQKGGIGLIDVYLKAKCIFTHTVMKSFKVSKKDDIIQYYMALRLNSLFGIRTLPRNFSYVNTPYYDFCVDIVRKCFLKSNNFPNVSSRKIYDLLFNITQPEIEKMYPNFDWCSIWKNVTFKYINIYDKHVVFKYIHEILTNNKKLYVFGHKISPNCDTCLAEESNIHMFLYCSKVQECINILYKTIFYLCDLNAQGLMLKLLFFDFPKVNKKIQNTLCSIISSYLTIVWYNRESPCYLSYKFKLKIIREQKLHKDMLKEKIHDIFSNNYCHLNPNILDNL